MATVFLGGNGVVVVILTASHTRFFIYFWLSKHYQHYAYLVVMLSSDFVNVSKRQILPPLVLEIPRFIERFIPVKFHVHVQARVMTYESDEHNKVKVEQTDETLGEEENNRIFERKRTQNASVSEPRLYNSQRTITNINLRNIFAS